MMQDDMRSLAADLRELLETGDLRARHIETTIGYLTDWADQTEAMQSRPVPKPLRSDPVNIIDLEAERLRRGLPPPCATQGPGGAA